jgi:hypothetical protein
VITNALVVSVPPTGTDDTDSSGDTSGGLVVLAARPAVAGRLAVAQAQSPLAFAMLP